METSEAAACKSAFHMSFGAGSKCSISNLVPYNVPRKVREDGSRAWAPETHMEASVAIPISCVWAGIILAIVTIWRGNKQTDL